MEVRFLSTDDRMIWRIIWPSVVENRTSITYAKNDQKVFS
jgi:hypothetical protein